MAPHSSKVSRPNSPPPANQGQPSPTGRWAPAPRPGSAIARRDRKNRIWSWIGALCLLSIAGGSAVELASLSYQFIVNPQAGSWLGRWLPSWTMKPTAVPSTQTLAAIQADIRRQGQTFGDWLPLGDSLSVLDGKSPVKDLLLPVLQTQSNCVSHCDRLIELRVYQAVPPQSLEDKLEPRYSLVQQLAVTGVEESLAIAPLVQADSSNQGSSRLLPLTQLERYDGTVPKTGVWLNLSGQRERGDEAIAYGQILYYYPLHHRLSVKLSWTSPANERPVWKRITGSDTPELVVNQTIGMEPQFEIYQVKPLTFIYSPLQLEAISLNAPALNDPQYRRALQLARNRLWSPSLVIMTAVKARSPQQWTATAQAQLALIQWHAQITATQADAAWSSLGQQVLANLLDGRWKRAEQVFTASVDASQETANILKADRDRLQRRIKAAIQANPKQFSVKAWGALLMAAQQNPNTAIAWLQQQPHTTRQDVEHARHLIQRLDPNFSEVAPLATRSPEATAPANSNPPDPDPSGPDVVPPTQVTSNHAPPRSPSAPEPPPPNPGQ